MVKRYSLLLCCVVLILISIRSFAQTPATTTPTPLPIVEYKWADGQLAGIMPFDQAFSFKVTGIPDNIQTIDVTFYEIRKNYNLFPINNSITYEEFKAMPWVKKYSLKTWERPPGGNDTFAFIAENYPLYPNSQYVIEIAAHSLKDLTADQQEALKDKINGSDAVKALFTNLTNTFGVGLKPYRLANSFVDELNKTIQTEVSSLDATYTFKVPPDELTQLTDVAAFVNSVRNIRLKAKELTNNGDASIAEIRANRTEAVNLVKTINKIDFGEFVFNPDSRTPLTEELAKLAITNVPAYDNRIKAVKNLTDSITVQADRLVETVVTNLVLSNTYILIAQGSNYPVAMSDQANNYLALDFGLAYVGNFSRIQSYYGLNIYLRPINKNIPIGRYATLKDYLLTHTSLLMGITFASVEKDNIRKGVLGDKGVLLGVGYRVLSFFKISAGGLLYYRYPANPLANKDNYSLKVSPFVSASFDLDMQALLGVFGNSFFPPKTTNPTP